jgi:hypothetical protein
MSRPL